MNRLQILLTTATVTGSNTATGGSGTATAKQIAEQFFAHYRAQNVPAMLTLFAEGGTVEYVPLGLKGLAIDIGPASWGVLIDAFPDLTNTVNQIWQDGDQRVAFVDVHIGGTQTKDAFGISNQGKHYWLRHLFIIETNEAGQITQVISFWDNADWFRQLGKTVLD